MYNTSNLNTQSSALPCFKHIMLYDDYTSKVLTIVNNNVLNYVNNFTRSNYKLYTVITKYTLIELQNAYTLQNILNQINTAINKMYSTR